MARDLPALREYNTDLIKELNSKVERYRGQNED